MRIVLNMVVKNETNRYLDACLSWVRDHVDEIFIYDDRSDDGSVEVAHMHGAHAFVRPLSEPSFLEAEGFFRQQGWAEMVRTLRLDGTDWVLSLDADEFPVPFSSKTLRAVLEGAGNQAVAFHVVELFSLNPLAQRVDGAWGRITATRLARFKSGKQEFSTHRMGCGMFPDYVSTGMMTPEVQILHFGYAEEVDRMAKHDRYQAVSGQLHSRSHIDSILRQPRLKEWTGEVPNVWRGVRI